jgi:predicted RNase H-like nuclease
VSLYDNESWDIGILNNISELSNILTDYKLILVDIPIGLKENGTSERLCDLEARKVLSLRKSSVFPAPCRQALNCYSYDEASRVNCEHTGRKLSKQTWEISGKIKQMDDFLAGVNTFGKVREFHPEIGFWALNHKVEMQNKKKTSEGFEERLNSLSKYCPFAKDIVIKAIVKYRTTEVARDDILDALAGAVTAKYSDSLGTLPQLPEKDYRGLAMEIVFRY